PQGGQRGLSRIVACADEPKGTGVWTRVKSVSPTFALSYSDRREKEDWKAFEKRRRASGVKGTAELPSRYFISERLAAEAEDAINSGSGRMVAVYRVGGGRIVLTGIEIDGQPIDQFVKAERKLRPASHGGAWKGFADTEAWSAAVHEDPNLRTWGRFNRETLRPFLEHEFVDRFRQGADATNSAFARFPEAVGKVLDGVWDRRSGRPPLNLDAFRFDVVRGMGLGTARQLIETSDPTLRIIAALRCPRAEGLKMLDRLDAEMSQEASLPRLLSALARVEFNKRRFGDREIKPSDATNITACAVALFERHAAEPEVTRAIHYLLTSVVSESHSNCNAVHWGFAYADREYLACRLETSKADPWVAKVVRAELESDRAWDVEVGGRGDDERWQREGRPHWLKARELYSAAWKIHPELPEGPYGAMICEWELRNRRAADLWMGHVHMAEIDNPQILSEIRGQVYGWFGIDRSTIVRAYRACERPDTMLPVYALDLAWQPSDGRFFADPKVRMETERLALTQVTNECVTPLMRGKAAFHLCNAIYAGGDWEKTVECGRRFGRAGITFNPDPTADVTDLFSVKDLTLLDVERDIRSGQLDVAQTELLRRGKGPRLGFYEGRYVTNALKRIAVLQKRDPAVYEDDDKKLMDVPFPLDDEWRELAIAPKSPLWFCGTYLKKAAGGGFALDTKMDPKSRDSAHSTHCWRRIPSDFECELELEFPDPKKGGVCALRIPVPRSTSGGFAQVAVTNGTFRAGGYYVGTHSRSIWKFLNPTYGDELDEQPKDGKVKMRVRVKNKRLSQWVNGQQTVFDWYVPAWKDPNFDEYTHVALLGGGVIVKRIRLRRVPVEVK
ncbi:MAG: hypothetical protein MJ249_15425, partial [Kiritimatiellae bacterium]|nr:hypothetical protein [Kiritimatiellia bacterium]